MRAEVASAAQLACLLEVSAPKPGNVSPGRHFADARYEEFLASAVAIGAPLASAGDQPLGRTIRHAVEATRRWTRSNTNLGIILLLAPLARAAMLVGGQTPERDDSRWRDEVRKALGQTTVQDASDVYAAIRVASPGGLGQAETQDVAAEPTMTLLEVMRLAAHRDAIAREYATGFATTFDLGAPTLRRARAEGASWEDGITDTFLTLLAAQQDTHIERRAGAARAAQVSALAREALTSGAARSPERRHAIARMDAALRDEGNRSNPGATADLTAAAIFVALLEGGWEMSQGGTHASAR